MSTRQWVIAGDQLARVPDCRVDYYENGLGEPEELILSQTFEPTESTHVGLSYEGSYELLLALLDLHGLKCRNDLPAELRESFSASVRYLQAGAGAGDVAEPQCGCHESYPQLEPGEVNHGPGCPLQFVPRRRE